MYSMVYTTVKNLQQSDSIAKELIEMELIACANSFEIRSTYHWEGELNTDKEIAIILKTKKELVQEVIDTLNDIHPYDVPCALEIPIEKGLQPYLDWIGSQTR